MKIICLEEHLADPEIVQASRDKISAEAPYAAVWGKFVQETAAGGEHDRPLLTSLEYSKQHIAESAEDRIAGMDEHGIAMQVLSYTFNSSPPMVPAGQAVALSKLANDRLAARIASHPDRFSGFAALPWEHPGAAAEELERAVNTLGLKATLLNGRPGETFIDDPRYEPILAKLDALNVPLYVHPGLPLEAVRVPYYEGFKGEVSMRLSLFGWGWHNEAGVQVIRMILSGVFDRHPNLQVISGHWGEMVPFFLQRLDDMLPMAATGLARTISETYRQHVHVTPSGMLQLPHFEFIRTVLGADRILFSIDYPYLTMNGARAFLESLPASQAEKEDIAHGNAERLLRL